MKNGLFKLTAMVLSFIMTASLAGMELFGAGCYDAKEDVKQALSDSKHVAVKETLSYISFEPTTYYDKGVIFYPGARVDEKAYAPLLHSLAEEGYLCVIAKMPLRLAILKPNAADEIREDYPNVADWYMSGHSLGSVMAADYAKRNANLMNGVIFLAGYTTQDLSDCNLDILSIYGSNDGILNMKKYEKYYSNLLNDTTSEQIIKGGNHAAFACYGRQRKDGECTVGEAVQREETVRLIDTFLSK